MVPTLFGLAVVGICLLMMIFKRPLREFFAGLLISCVFGSAEAVALPMLGGASLTVPYFFVLFLILRLLLLARKQPALFMEAFNANIWLVVFAIYGVAGAMILPRLFEGSMSVFSMRPLPYRTLLTFSSQNITQGTYMVLTALTGIATYATARLPKADSALYNGALIFAVLFVLFGLLDLVGYYAGGRELMAWARTANYAILSQVEDGVRRISGSFTEPSAFAGAGALPLLLFSYLWLVDIRGALSGLLTIAVAVMMALSTSTTAFAMLAVTLMVIGVSMIITPLSGKTRRTKFISLGVAMVCGVGALAVVAFLLPQFLATFGELVEKMTVGKSKSASAIERGTWAAQGITAFHVSHGFGVGPGSFRSSGLIQAILGSTGIFGMICFLAMCFQLLRALFRKVPGVDRRIVIATAMTALLILTPSMSVGAAPDVGILFGAMMGFALGRQRKAMLIGEARKAEDNYYERREADLRRAQPA